MLFTGLTVENCSFTALIPIIAVTITAFQVNSYIIINVKIKILTVTIHILLAKIIHFSSRRN